MGNNNIIFRSIKFVTRFKQLYRKIYNLFQSFLQKLDFGKIKLPAEIQEVLQNSTGDILTNISMWARNF